MNLGYATRWDLRPLLEGIRDEKLRKKVLKMHDRHEKRIYYYPAAVYMHHWWEGGWADHTAQVIDAVQGLYGKYLGYPRMQPSTTYNDMVVAAFVHDFDKLWRYTEADPKKKVEKPGMAFQSDKSIVGYEETSKAIAETFRAGIKLTDVQIEAINHHHGGFSTDLSSPYHRHGGMSPFSSLLHCADMLSAFGLGHCKPAIKVMADFTSNGLWELYGGCMLEYADLDIPKRLKEEFEAWIRFYDDECTERPSYVMKKDMAGECNHRGRELAKKVKKLHPDLDVWYWGDTGGDKRLVKEEIKGV